MERVTIVIPAFNAAQWLAECLDSILAQTYTDWLAIIVDDGSTDNTAAIAAGYVRPGGRFRLLSRPNGGPSAARNTALDAVATKYVTFVDADDTLHPEALQRLMSLADSHPEVPIVACWYTACPFDPAKPLSSAKPTVMSAQDAVIATLRRQPYHEPMSCAKAFRTDLFKDIRYTDGRRYEDLDIFYKLYWRAGSIVHDTAPIYFYRQHPASFVHSWDSHRADVLDVTDDITTWAEDLHNPALTSAVLDRRLSARFSTLVGAVRAKRDNTLSESDAQALDAVITRCRADIRADRCRALADPRTRLRSRLALLLPYAILRRL